MTVVLDRWKEYDQAEVFWQQALKAKVPNEYLKIKYLCKYGVSLTARKKYKLALSYLQDVYEKIKQQSHNPKIKRILLKCMNALAYCYRALNDLENAAKISTSPRILV